MVAAGRGHVAIVTEGGQVLTFGYGADGRLGNGLQEDRALPCFVQGNFQESGLDSEQTVMVACGWFHTAAVTATGKCYVWGFGGAGQLGVGETSCKLLPTLIPPHRLGGERVSMVACGLMQTCVVTDEVRCLDLAISAVDVSYQRLLLLGANAAHMS